MADIEFNKGVLFVATGDKYVRSATRCARSIKKHSPDLPIHLFTDELNAARLEGSNDHPFSAIAVIPNPNRRSKVEYMSKTPFERTLFLDSDTDVVTDIREMFDLLDRFDIALAHAPKRNEHKNQVFWKVRLPSSFPQFNSGVVLYQKNDKVLQLLAKWQEDYINAGFKIDQITLREALWQSDVLLATLPPEYNVRYGKYKYVWNELEARPKIYHMPKYHNSFLMRLRSPFYRLYKIGRYYGSKIKGLTRG